MSGNAGLWANTLESGVLGYLADPAHRSGSGAIHRRVGAELVMRFGLAAPVDQRFVAMASVLVLLLATLGLIASFFQLGRPQRA